MIEVAYAYLWDHLATYKKPSAGSKTFFFFSSNFCCRIEALVFSLSGAICGLLARGSEAQRYVYFSQMPTNAVEGLKSWRKQLARFLRHFFP